MKMTRAAGGVGFFDPQTPPQCGFLKEKSRFFKTGGFSFRKIVFEDSSLLEGVPKHLIEILFADKPTNKFVHLRPWSGSIIDAQSHLPP